MPDNLITGGVGGIGALVGIVLGFLGLKPRLEALEKNTVKKDSCEVVKGSFHDLLDRQDKTLREIRTDIKAILKNGGQ